MPKYLSGLLFFVLIIICSWLYSSAAFHHLRYLTSKTPQFAAVEDSIVANTAVSFCDGQSVVLRKFANNSGTHQWLKDGVVIPSATSSSYTAAETGLYSLQITRSGVPTLSNEIQVTKKALPVAAFSHVGDITCPRPTLTFTNTSTGIGLTYLWDFGDPNSGSSNTSTAGNPIHKFVGTPGASTQNFTVKLTVTSSEGCVTSIQKVISLKQRPGSELIGPGADTYNGAPIFTICTTSSTALFTFRNNSSTLATNAGYRIIWGDGAPDYTDPSFSGTVTHTYGIGLKELKLLITDAGGCVDTTAYQIYVGSNPSVGLGNPGNTNICSGSPLTFPISGTSTNPAGTIYTVNFGDGTIETYTQDNVPANVTHIYTVSSCGTTINALYPNSYSVSIEASNPCSKSSAVVVPVYVSEKPTAAITLTGSPTYCLGISKTFTNTSAGLKQVSASGTCSTAKSVWTIVDESGTTIPPSGYTLTSGQQLGADFGEADPDMWSPGSATLTVKFNAVGKYKIKLKTGSKCGTDVTEKEVCVVPTPIASFDLDKNSGCGPLVVNATSTTAAPACGANTYQWTVAHTNTDCAPGGSAFTYTNGTSASHLNPQFTFTNPGVYTIRLVVVGPDGTCSSTQVSKTVTVKAKPLVSFTAPTAACVGADLNPAVVATVSNCYSGSTETYLWEAEDGTVALPNQKVPGAISFSSAGSKNLKLTVTNECGTTVLTKNVTVSELPVLTVPADISSCPNQLSGAFTFSSSVAGTTYTWTNNNAAIGLASSGSGSITSFTLRNTTAAAMTATITVTPRIGTCTGTSKQFKITVDPAPAGPVVTTPVQYCVGAVPSALVATAATGHTLKWYTGSSGGTGSTTVPVPTTSIAGSHFFYVSQTTGSGCESARVPITVTVNAIPAAPVASTVVNLCKGTTASGLTATQSPGHSLIWLNANGDTLSSAPVPNTSVIGQTKYFVSQVSAAGCEGPKKEIIVNVADLPGLPVADTQITYCFGATAVPLIATASAGSTLKWYTAPGGGTALTAAPTPNTNVAGTISYYVSQVGSSNCESARLEVKVTILPSVQITSNLNAVSLCNEETFNYQVTSSQAGATIRWTRSAVPGIQNPTDSGDVNIAEKLINTGTVPVIVTYQLTAIANGCSVIREKKVTVNPTLVISSGLNASPICSSSQFTYVPASSTPGATFSWSRAAVSGITNPSSSGAGSINETLVNNTDAPVEVKYVIVPSYSGCQGEARTLTLTVNPGVSFSSPPTTPAICTGSLFTYAPASNTPGAIFTWTRATVNGISNPQGTGSDTINEVLVNTTTRPIVVVYRYRIDANNCVIFRDVSLTINPKPRAEFSAPATNGCNPFNIGSTISLNPHTDANGSYEWYANGVLAGTGQTVPSLILSGDNATLTLKLVTTSKYGCGRDSTSMVFKTAEGVAAGFTMNKKEGCGPVSISLTNITNDLPGSTYAWDFGNGKHSDLKNPGTVVFDAHPANRDSTYYVTLTVNSGCQTVEISDSVRVIAAPIAVLSPSKTVGCSPMKVDFTNHSKGTNTYQIDFGDGTSMLSNSLESFSHTYNTSKKDTFTVKLTALNGCGANVSSYDIIVSPNTIVPELVVSGSSKFGCAPFTVNFDNNSVGANKFDWDFGDGTIRSSTSAPESQTHTFTSPGTYLVRLRATNGCSDTTTTETITVYPSIVSSIGILKDEFCPNESIKFESTALSDVSWLWDFGDGSKSTLQSPSHPFATAGTKNVRLTVFRAFPDGTVCSNTISKQIKVIDKPQPGFSSNANLLNCAPFNFTVSGTPANSSNAEWNFGDPGSTDNLHVGHSAAHIYKKPGLYTVTQIVYNLAGCTDTLRQTVRITESPEVSFAIPDTSICENSTPLNLVNTTTYGGTDIVSYSWYLDGKKVSSSKDLLSSFAVSDGTVLPYRLAIKLVANSTIGCETSLTRYIQFNPLPKSLFSTAINAACAPYTLQIANNSKFADRYKWYLNGQLVSTETNPTNISLAENGKSFILKLVASSEFGCVADSIEKTVTTYPKPTALFSLQDSISCNGILDLKVSNLSSGANTFNWSFGDGSLDQSTAIPKYAYGKPGVYNLRLITSNGLCADTLIKQIRIAGLVTTAFIPGQTTGCSLISVTFQNLSANADSYLWDFGDGTFSTSKNPTHNFNFTKSPYTIKLIGFGEFGCTDTTVVVNQIYVSAPPKADFDVLPDSIIKIPDYTFNFKSTTGDSIKHSWDFGDGKKSILQDPSHTYPDTGKFLVTLIAENKEGCKDTIQRIVQVSGVPGRLFVPNAFEPGSGKMSLRTFKPVGSGIEAYRIQVFDKWGRLMWESKEIDEEGSPVDGWDGTFKGEPMPQGVYVWKIESKFINGTDWKGMIYQNSSMPHKVGSIHLIR